MVWDEPSDVLDHRRHLVQWGLGWELEDASAVAVAIEKGATASMSVC